MQQAMRHLSDPPPRLLCSHGHAVGRKAKEHVFLAILSDVLPIICHGTSLQAIAAACLAAQFWLFQSDRLDLAGLYFFK